MDELFLRNERNPRRISLRSSIAQENELKVALAYATVIMQLHTWKSIVRWAPKYLLTALRMRVNLRIPEAGIYDIVQVRETMRENYA